MPTQQNAHNQPIGFSLEGWQPPVHPPHVALFGRYCHLEPLNATTHAAQLYKAHTTPRNDADWTYLPYGPFDQVEPYHAWLSSVENSRDPQFYTIIEAKSKTAIGVASYLRITPQQGSIEVGHIHFAPALRQTPAATEAMFLMMHNVFELGYRRYEWKCDSLNAPSRAAALRYGFSFEGIFRQAVVYKERNRDTSWFGMTDGDWAALKTAYETWLEPTNFDEQGNQLQSLSKLIEQSR